MALQEYARKRDFTRTPEPKPSIEEKKGTNTARFFIQRHNASRLHYDFRLEIDGTLKSWAIPKGPSLDPGTKRLAAMVEDHPISYGDFEGNIPKDNYGAGSVMLWDRGTFELIGDETALAQIARGDLKFQLYGEKLAGTWALVHMKNRGKGNEWLLIKKKDDAADPEWDIDHFAYSVKTNRTQDEIAFETAPLDVQKKDKAKAAKKIASFDASKLPGAVKAPMPGFFAPMGAALTPELPAKPAKEDWIFEIKWDGVRGLVYIDNGSLAIYTRNQIRCEAQYPELHGLPGNIAATQAILDGEIAVLDERGISRFELIQSRIQQKDPDTAARMARKQPVLFVVFDLLYLDGYDLRGVPLADRKKALAAIVTPSPVFRVSDHLEAVAEEALEAATQMGLEGLIAKRTNSVYVSHRSRDWLKVKLTAQQEFVIVGFTPGEREPFGSLALGYYDNQKLVFAGNVGTGFNAKNMADLWERLQPLVVADTALTGKGRPPRGTKWVKPELVAQIKFANWTGDKRLRAPVYLGLRNDTSAEKVVREDAAPERTEGLFAASKKEITLDLNGHSLRFTNLDKVYYPKDGYTKRDLLNYYDAVSKLILPYLKDRPLSLKRYPNGIDQKFFFQKHTPESYPDWLRTETIGDKKSSIRYALIEDEASLLYLTNLGCIDQNPWMSRVGSLESPDFILLDLDPHDCNFSKVVEAALLVKAKLDAIGLKGYPKTTGGDGLHIYIPVEPHYDYEQVRRFAEVMAHILSAEQPSLFTMPRSVAEREKDRVYFDYPQIAESKTISAPYVARAYPGAPVSTPLAWEELTPQLHPSQFHIMNAPERFAQVGDLFSGVLNKRQKLDKAIPRLEKFLRK